MKVTVRAMRLIRGMTQRQVADELGMNRDTYRNLEKNPGNFTMAQAKKLSEVFEVSLDSIFFID